jgi:3-oxoacyl-[acyl-carrier-protein] synthase-3
MFYPFSPDWFENLQLHTDGSGAPNLHMKAGGPLRPPSHETVENKEHFVLQKGHNIKLDNLAWLVPHQANLRIIEATARRMGIKKEKVMINIDRYGNTTAATISLCLWEWEDQLKKNDKIILASFGGGYTWGSIYIKWAYDGKNV